MLSTVMSATAVSCCTLLTALISGIDGHGYLWTPPGRAVAYRKGFNIPADVNHMGINCGGFSTQWDQNEGKCGVCGDRYDLPVGQRLHEPGGKYAPVDRMVTGSYVVGGTLRAEAVVTAHHKGFFEFRLCVNNDFAKPVTQECLDQTVLKIKGTSETKYYITNDYSMTYTIDLQLPAGVSCSQCVLQWNYTAGNNWGQWPGEPGCMGCGKQETFINCADIEIGETSTEIIPGQTQPATSAPAATRSDPPKSTTLSVLTDPPSGQGCSRRCRGPKDICYCNVSQTYKNVPGMQNWCDVVCRHDGCDESHCICYCN